MTPDEFRKLGHQLIEDIAAFYESFGDRELTRAAEPGDIRALLGSGELPEHGEDVESLLRGIAPVLFDHSLHNGHPKFFGYITSSAAPLGALADLLAAAVNANVGKWDLAPVASEIETQVVPGMTGFVDYGSYQYVRPLKGSFGVIDEVDDTHGPEASITGICLVPSLEALVWILHKVGFSRVNVLQPPEDAYEQLRYHKRVMVAAEV